MFPFCLENIHALGLDPVEVVTGPFQKTLSTVLNDHHPIDYAFIDGHHDEKATLDYFEQIVPFLSDGAVLVFDDIAWTQGMKRAWKKIINDDRVSLVFDLWQVGICVIDSQINEKDYVSIPLI